jgi:rubrerythrin
LSDDPSLTYAYYQEHIKPKPEATAQTSEGGKKKWVCEVCGYVYEGDELPADFICPWCKHPASDFKLVE